MTPIVTIDNEIAASAAMVADITACVQEACAAWGVAFAGSASPRILVQLLAHTSSERAQGGPSEVIAVAGPGGATPRNQGPPAPTRPSTCVTRAWWVMESNAVRGPGRRIT